MSFLNDLTMIQRLGLGGIVLLLLVLLLVRRRQAAAAGGSTSEKASKADKPKKAKKVKAEKPAKAKRSRRSKADKGERRSKRRRRGKDEEDLVAPPEPPAAPPASVPVVAAAASPAQEPAAAPSAEEPVVDPGWPAPGEAWVDPYGVSPADADMSMRPSDAVGDPEFVDPTAGEPDAGDDGSIVPPAMPAYDEIEPVGQAAGWTPSPHTDWAQPEQDWTPADDISALSGAPDGIPASEQAWTPADGPEWARSEQEWEPQEPEWTPPEQEWQQQDASEWSAAQQDWTSGESSSAQPAQGWEEPEQDWPQQESAWNASDAVSDEDTAWSQSASPGEPDAGDDTGVDMADALTGAFEPIDGWAGDDADPGVLDQLVSEATGVGIDPPVDATSEPGSSEEFTSETDMAENAWQPVDDIETDDPVGIATTPLAVPADDPVADPDPEPVAAAVPVDAPWPVAPAVGEPSHPDGRHSVNDVLIAAGREDRADDEDDVLPSRRPALEALHHLSARGGHVTGDDDAFADPVQDTAAAAGPSEATPSTVPQESATPMPVDTTTPSYAEPAATQTPSAAWGAYASPESTGAATGGVAPTAHAPSPRDRWADMTPAPVKPAETLAPVERWARLRPSSGSGSRPAGPPPNTPSTPAPAPSAPAADGDPDLRRGRFALGGYALQAGQEIVSGVTYRSVVAPPPTRWLLGPVSGPVPAGTLVLTVEGHVNCDERDIEVVMDAGFAPTVDGFSLRLRAAEEGSFAASGTFRIH